MPIRVSCPSCSAQLNVKDELAGRMVKCPKCGGTMTVPAAAPVPPPPPAPAPEPEKAAFEEMAESPSRPATDDDTADVPPRPKAKPASDDADEDDDRPKGRRRKDEDEDEDDRPARGKGKGKGRDRGRPSRRRDDDDDGPPKKSKLPLILGIGAGVLLLCCGGVGYGIYYAFVKTKEGLNDFVDKLERTNPAVNLPNYERIKVGETTRSQVDQILGVGRGRPATVEDINKAYPQGGGWVEVWGPKIADGRAFVWINNDDHLFVAFHPDAGPGGKVQMKAITQNKGAVTHADSSEKDDASFAKKYGKGGDGDGGPTGPAKKGGGGGPSGKGGPAVEIKADELAKAFKDNPKAAEAKYKDKTVVVEGKINDILQARNGVEILLDGVPPPLPDSVEPGIRIQCQLAGDGKNAWSFSRGQTVRLRGTCFALTGPFVTVEDCRVEYFDPVDPAIRVAIGPLATEFNTDPKAADAKYKGKQIYLDLPVVVDSKIDAGVTDNAGLIIVFQSKKGAGSLKIRAEWPPGADKQVDAVKPKDRVKIKGEYAGFADGTLTLKRCWLVP